MNLYIGMTKLFWEVMGDKYGNQQGEENATERKQRAC